MFAFPANKSTSSKGAQEPCAILTLETILSSQSQQVGYH